MYAIYASASVAGYAMILAQHVAKRCKGQSPTIMRLYAQAKSCMTMKNNIKS